MVSVLVHDPSNASCEALDVEIDEQAYAHVTEPEVRQKLREVDGDNLFNRFDLNDYAAIDDHVDSISRVESGFQIVDRQHKFGLDLLLSFSEVMSRAGLINAFEQPWTEF
jgi:hypothetical protein